MQQPAYRLARNIYQRTLNRKHWELRERQRNLFVPFVRRHDIVFDIGANLGHIAETFFELGAKVLAVEPNPVLADRIRRHYGDRVKVEAVAVGDQPGELPLMLGRYDGHSTLSDEWRKRAGTDRWAGEITVPVVTLDQLIHQHGSPAFIKIDVEGYESSVLSGLSAPVPALSFEFQRGYPENLRACLNALGGDYSYAMKPVDSWSLGEWVDGPAVLQQVATLPPNSYGDIFAKRL